MGARASSQRSRSPPFLNLKARISSTRSTAWTPQRSWTATSPSPKRSTTATTGRVTNQGPRPAARRAVYSRVWRSPETAMPAPSSMAAGAIWRITTTAMLAYSSSTAGSQPGPA